MTNWQKSWMRRKKTRAAAKQKAKIKRRRNKKNRRDGIDAPLNEREVT
jgi:hypothetical protein